MGFIEVIGEFQLKTRGDELTILDRREKENLSRSGLRLFVQAVAEPAHNFDVINLAVGEENYGKRQCALYLLALRRAVAPTISALPLRKVCSPPE